MGHGCHECGSPNSCECPKTGAINLAGVALISGAGVQVKQWRVRDERYRLVRIGPSTKKDNVPDTFILEKVGKDATGGDRWDYVDKWNKDSSGRWTEVVLAMGLME